MTRDVLQLNESVTGSMRVPYSFFKKQLYPNGGRMLRRSEIMILGAVFSYSCVKDMTCNMTYHKFEEKLGLSHGTVARGIKALKESGEISQDKSRRTGAAYRSMKPLKESGFIKIEFYLYSTKFEVRGEKEPRYLPKAAIDVLCLMKTHCSNEKTGGVFLGSVRGIAHTLNLSPTTVQKSIDLLMRAKLVFRNESGRGLNAHKRSTFTVNQKLIRKAEKKFRKGTTAPAQSSDKQTSCSDHLEAAADARAEFDRYYDELRRRALNRAEWFENCLEQDDTYRRVNGDLQALKPKIARAEIYRAPELAWLLSEQKRLEGERARRMAALNISEVDLTPQWRCNKCNDTGFHLLDGKMCDCYPRRGQKQ